MSGLDNTNKSNPTCIFDLQGNRCLNPKHDGYDYCLVHLEYLTKINVKIIAVNIIVKELGVDSPEVPENARFIDDLGADSLDIVALIMALEEAFGLKINNEDAEKLQSVRDAVGYLTSEMLRGERYVIHPTVDFPVIHRSIESKPENVHRILKQIIEGELFQDYFRKLQLESQKVERIFQLVIRNNWIDHFTTVPRFDENRSLYLAHIFFLCRVAIYHFTLQPKEIYFQSYALDELKLSYQIQYADGGDISSIKVSRSTQDAENNEDDQKTTFTFRTQEGIEEALTFLNKFLSNVEKK